MKCDNRKTQIGLYDPICIMGKQARLRIIKGLSKGVYTLHLLLVVGQRKVTTYRAVILSRYKLLSVGLKRLLLCVV